MLPHAEYVEQAYLFDLLNQRIGEQTPMQEMLGQFSEELLSTTRLPMAIDYLLTELRHSGMMSPAMRHMSHYFAPFQTFLIEEAEREGGRFTMPVALQVLLADARLRANFAAGLEAQQAPSPQAVTSPQPASGGASPRLLGSPRPASGRAAGGEGFPAPAHTVNHPNLFTQHSRSGFFFFQFETLCRNRLGYDAGLTAMSGDDVFDETWSGWILELRAQIGLVDLADLIFLASEDYQRRQQEARRLTPAQFAEMQSRNDRKPATLFGEKEGRIAFANRRKDPLYLFGAMQRHLGYPPVPRALIITEDRDTIPQLLRRIERMETRIKIIEQEQKQEFDLSKFYKKPTDD